MRPTLIYVTGLCRAESTTLGNVLGEAPGVFHAGELRSLWRDGVLRTGAEHCCGCGLEHDRCPIWSQVLDAITPGTRDPLAYAEDVRRDQTRWRTRHIRRAGSGRVTGEWPRTLANTYRAVADVTGAEVVIDSSRYASDAALARRAGFPTVVVHLVHDPRTFAYSSVLPADDPRQRGPLAGVYLWLGTNIAGQRLVDDEPRASLVLRCEDFAERPRSCVDRVLALIEREPDNPVTEDGSVRLGSNHTVAGDPGRFRRGLVRLRREDPQPSELGFTQRAGLTLLAGPQLRRYNYSWRG